MSDPRPAFVPGHFDNPPLRAITAEDVRRFRAVVRDGRVVRDDALRRLLEHPGVSSSARAVIEAALEE